MRLNFATVTRKPVARKSTGSKAALANSTVSQNMDGPSATQYGSFKVTKQPMMVNMNTGGTVPRQNERTLSGGHMK